MRAGLVRPAGTWPDWSLDTITLDGEDRHRRRAVLTTDGGTEFLLDLPDATWLRHGDGLQLDDGRMIKVQAAPEDVVDITAASPAALVRIAWHLGNRHLPTQLLDNGLRIRRDHVIEALVELLGGTMEARSAPFDPEGGAYGHGRTHAHEHGHEHGHSHGHGHGHGRDHRHHDHDHDHAHDHHHGHGHPVHKDGQAS
ncbi:urease accessory protein UreE [Microvirga tunisiensis]|uniref:Urease accessory protein UreE n=1 Tax=Pannonibacter tanglangensis TaxID=2750084 RepID=A0A7X5F5M5_9HYPH|nr:urease accessory protein UreE [Pannonibacter sp. XCT-53]NBN80208.1 urease accessory protein UreE [Pannonibacter sp. XCT-53]